MIDDYKFIAFFLFAGFLMGVCAFGLYSSLQEGDLASRADFVGFTPQYVDMPTSKYLFNVSGVNATAYYSYEGYFCVITKDRTPQEVSTSVFHELAHYFVDVDTDHFVPDTVLERVSND